MTTAPALVHLRRGGTSLIVRTAADALPTVLHWGAEIAEDDLSGLLPALERPVGDSVVYAQPHVGVVPLHATGWLGHPGVLGHRDGAAWSFGPNRVEHEVHEAGESGWEQGPAGAVRLLSTAVDDATDLELTTELELHPSGVLRVRASLRNLGPDGYEVTGLEPGLPVPLSATELLDMTGRHTRERTPQRHRLETGRWAREAWGGRPGHDNATVLIAGEPGFGWRRGAVWGVHLAWSGNGVMAAERTTNAWQLLRGGELLLPREAVLARGEAYASPWLVASWGEGLDAFAGRIHEFLRARPQHPATPRPIILNTWEAVYFDHDLPRLLELAERAAAVGVERFVLDDGWFLGRRADDAGLGDWVVDPVVWPNGLGPLADRVHGLGMEFGLWFEPEMVNLDSELARAHPDWVLGTERGPGVPSRQQHVLDLGNPDAFAHVLERMSALVAEYRIDYIKWDHNRPLVDAGRQPSFAPGVHAQTLAAYRLFAELKAAHPGLEIESCCGGGGRVDLGIMEHADRVWVSDCIDAHERQRMQRWISLLLPPELLGTHVGADQDHSTGRILDLDYRAGTAVRGHLGIEWDLTSTADADLATLRDWIALHKELRPLLHGGRVVHADPIIPAVEVEGVVAQDGSDALFTMAVVDHALDAPFGRIVLPGLDPARRYRVRVQEPSGRSIHRGALPGWVEDGVELSGAVLGRIGLEAPTLSADRLVLIRATAV